MKMKTPWSDVVIYVISETHRHTEDAFMSQKYRRKLNHNSTKSEQLTIISTQQLTDHIKDSQSTDLTAGTHRCTFQKYTEILWQQTTCSERSAVISELHQRDWSVIMSALKNQENISTDQTSCAARCTWSEWDLSPDVRTDTTNNEVMWWILQVYQRKPHTCAAW